MAIVTVFVGSNMDPPIRYRQAALLLGRRLAEAGHAVRTGAGDSPSLMGLVVDGARAAGGRVEGVILDLFMRVQHPRLKTEVVTTMSRRKKQLVRGTKALIVMPGGFGTLDEMFEVLVLHQIGVYHGPVIVLNLDRYFDPIEQFIRRAKRENFLQPKYLKKLKFVRSVAAAIRSVKG